MAISTTYLQTRLSVIYTNLWTISFDFLCQSHYEFVIRTQYNILQVRFDVSVTSPLFAISINLGTNRLYNCVTEQTHLCLFSITLEHSAIRIINDVYRKMYNIIKCLATYIYFQSTMRMPLVQQESPYDIDYKHQHSNTLVVKYV